MFKNSKKLVILCLMIFAGSSIDGMRSLFSLGARFKALSTLRQSSTVFAKSRVGRIAALGAVPLLATAAVALKAKHDPAAITVQGTKAKNPHTIFSHGLGGNKSQGGQYHIRYNGAGFIEGPLVLFNFADHNNIHLSSLGQEADYQTLHGVYKNKAPVILAGVSRGAATTINELGINKPTNVLAAVVESPFDHVQSISDNIIGLAGWIPGVSWLAHKLVPQIYTGYNPNGIQPIDTIDKISKDIPLLIVCSKKDMLIPYASSINLYKKLIASGHTKAYLFVTDEGEHANILWGTDGGRYRNVVHAFYKKYGIPYNDAWANGGYEQFKLCQPSLADLNAPNAASSLNDKRKI